MERTCEHFLSCTLPLTVLQGDITGALSKLRPSQTLQHQVLAAYAYHQLHPLQPPPCNTPRGISEPPTVRLTRALLSISAVTSPRELIPRHCTYSCSTALESSSAKNRPSLLQRVQHPEPHCHESKQVMIPGTKMLMGGLGSGEKKEESRCLGRTPPNGPWSMQRSVSLVL